MTTNLVRPPVRTRATPNVTPFTYYDGLTYLEILEALRKWLNDVLAPAFDDLQEYVDGEIADLIALVDQKIADLESGVADDIADLTQYVDDAVQSIINNSIEVQDPVVAALVENPNSATGIALSNKFVSKDSLYYLASDHGVIGDGNADDTATMQALIDTVPNGATIVAPVGAVYRTDGWAVEGKSITLDLRNAHLVRTSANPIFTGIGAWGETVGVGSVETTPRGNVLNVSSSLDFAVGDLVRVFSDNVVPDSRQRPEMGDEFWRQGEFVTVESVETGVITTTPRLLDTYTLNTRAARMEHLPVKLMFGTADFDASVGGGGGAAFMREMFVFDALWGPHLSGHVIDQPGSTARFRSCFRYTTDIEVDNAPEADGYGVSDNGSRFGRNHIVMRRGRHAFTDGGAVRTTMGNLDPGSYGRSMQSFNTGASMGLMQAHWDTHHGGYGHVFSGIIASGSPTNGVPAFSLRGESHTIIGSSVDGLPVGVRIHDEEVASWATSQNHLITDLTVRNVSQAIVADLLNPAPPSTVPTVTVSGGVFETIGSTPLYARRANVHLKDPTFKVNEWNSGFAAPIICAAARITGNVTVVNNVGEIGSTEIISAANSDPASRIDLDAYYISTGTDGDGLSGFARTNNAIASVRLRSLRPFPLPVVLGSSVGPSLASGTFSCAEGDYSSALRRQVLTGGAEITLGRSGDAIVTVAIGATAGATPTASGIARGSHGGQLLILTNTFGGQGVVTIPASGDNLSALESDIVLEPGDTATLVWNSERSNLSWARVS